MNEQNFCTRIITDISNATSEFPEIEFNFLMRFFEQTPGLASDKLKSVLQKSWSLLEKKINGIVLAYDEAQILRNRFTEGQYPLSLLLEAIQYLQGKELPFLLVLTGLPTIFLNMEDTKAYSERMFITVNLDRLNPKDSEEAILYPLESKNCPIKFEKGLVKNIIDGTEGHPYFIQFLCKEVFDAFSEAMAKNEEATIVMPQIMRKLDSTYEGRWRILNSDQKNFLITVSNLAVAEKGFKSEDVLEVSKNGINETKKMLSDLVAKGILYEHWHGQYFFALPSFTSFIRRQTEPPEFNR